MALTLKGNDEKEGLSGKKPSIGEQIFTPERARDKERGYLKYLERKYLAEEIAKALNREDSPPDDTPSIQIKPMTLEEKISLFCVVLGSAICLAMAYLFLTIATMFSFVWWLGVVLAVLGIPSLIAACGAMGAVFFYLINHIHWYWLGLFLIYPILKLIIYFIAHPM